MILRDSDQGGRLPYTRSTPPTPSTRLVAAAGVPRIRLHDTRHTAATVLLAQGVPLKVVSERLGHSSVSITADVYQHVSEHMQDEAATKAGAAMLGPEDKFRASR